MSRPTSSDARLARALKKEKLDDLSPFAKKGFFDEIPLYSRFAQVAFLDHLGREEADKILIAFGLKYLEAVVGHAAAAPALLAAVTVVDFGEGDPLVPNIFVCNGNVEKLLAGKLVLRPPRKAFPRRIVQIVEELSLSKQYRVLQDDVTIPGFVRVFVGHRSPPQPSMIGIERFATAARPKKLRKRA